MRDALSCGLSTMLLAGLLVSQAVQPEPFGFKNDKLGMSLNDFKAAHLEPGVWENEAGGMSSGGDFHRSPTGKGWKWKSFLNCAELVGGVITRCRYNLGIDLGMHTDTFFVDGKLAVIGVSDNNLSPLVPQALVDGLGPPRRLLAKSNGYGWYALRWDNGVSVIQFQEHYCHSGTSNNFPQEFNDVSEVLRTQFPQVFNDVAEVLRGGYCEVRDSGGGEMGAFIWYVHRSLFSLTVRRWEEAAREIVRKARSEPFTFDDKLGMNIVDFKAHGVIDCKETARAVTECRYITTILGNAVFAGAIFMDGKLAAIHLYHVTGYWGIHGREISGIWVPVDIRQALITKFGPPEIIRGCGDSALHWDDGASVVEYQEDDCGGASEGDEYKRITKILQRRYCEKGDSGNGTFSIWDVDKALFAVAVTRRREADADARKKALSDMFPSKNGVQGSTPKTGVPAQTVEKGQTPDQVQATLGKPDEIVNLGTRMIYVYKDVAKVTFLNGKVSDVQ